MALLLLIQRINGQWYQHWKRAPMRFIKICSIICITLIACAKKAHPAKQVPDTGLAGTWEWERTDGGIGHHIHDTPQSTGKNRVLKLNADSTYTFYTNSVLTAQGTYRTEPRTCIHDHARKPFLVFSDDPGMMVEKLDAGSLALSDESYDGVESRYKRTVNTK
jgi:hypothetical protein